MELEAAAAVRQLDGVATVTKAGSGALCPAARKLRANEDTATAAHNIPEKRTELVREVIAWLDKCLGKVK